MPTIALTVECKAAATGRCHAREIVRLAEDAVVPLTWLIEVSPRDPLSNVDLYHTEYYHRIPSWHEMGLCVAFESSTGHITEERARHDAIRTGKDVLKSRHVKPTSFRASGLDLQPSDIHCLEDIGILVDASVCAETASSGPYHPSYTDLATPGSARLLVAPLARHEGVCGMLSQGWEKVRPVVERCCAGEAPAVLSLTDDVDSSDALRGALELGAAHGARFVTLTQLAALCRK